MRLEPSFRDIAPHELVSHLLRASGQEEGEAVNPAPILDLLGLTHLSLDFGSDLPEAVTPRGDRPRALLSFPERVVATDRELKEERARFSSFHEVGHYVLPDHVESIVLCSDRDLSRFARGAREQQANAFAADLLFHGVRFCLEANSLPICAGTVKDLAEKYRASYEATARRLVEKNLRPCMLVVYEQVAHDRRIDLWRQPEWDAKYSVPSPAFARGYFTRVASNPENPHVARVTMAGRDVAESIRAEERIPLRDGRTVCFQMEYFSNQYNVFCLLQPAEKKA